MRNGHHIQGRQQARKLPSPHLWNGIETEVTAQDSFEFRRWIVLERNSLAIIDWGQVL